MPAPLPTASPGHRLRGRITAIHAAPPGRRGFSEIEVAVADGLLRVPCSRSGIARHGWQVGQAVAVLIPGDAAVLLNRAETPDDAC